MSIIPLSILLGLKNPYFILHEEVFNNEIYSIYGKAK